MMMFKFIAGAAVVSGSWCVFHKTNSKPAHWALLIITLAILATIAN